MGDMKMQVAVVTGGIRGIGLAASERLLNRGVTVAAGYATRGLGHFEGSRGGRVPRRDMPYFGQQVTSGSSPGTPLPSREPLS